MNIFIKIYIHYCRFNTPYAFVVGKRQHDNSSKLFCFTWEVKTWIWNISFYGLSISIRRALYHHIGLSFKYSKVER